jgi:hypothetical protein
MDVSPDLGEEFRQRWRDIDIVQISQPFRGLAVRFQNSVYAPADEDLPESVSTGVREISLRFPDVRIVLLRTECWGGDCSTWGQFIRNGQLLMNEYPMGTNENKETLRRLMSNLDVDIGPSEIVEPLSSVRGWTMAR